MVRAIDPNRETCISGMVSSSETRLIKDRLLFELHNESMYFNSELGKSSQNNNACNIYIYYILTEKSTYKQKQR